MERNTKKGNGGWWAIIILLIVVILFAVTTPSREQHKEELTGDVSEAVVNSVIGDNPTFAALGEVFFNKVVDMAIDSNIEYSNYLVCSITTGSFKDKSSLLSVGVLNYVFVLFDKKDLENIIKKEVDKQWQSIKASFSDRIFGEKNATADKAAPNDSTSREEDWEGMINRGINEMGKRTGKALERGMSDAVEGFIKGLLGDEE